jgi:hypothetical protein
MIDRSPIAGVRVIGLSEHVDYWNQLGWRDPFSDVLFTRARTAEVRPRTRQAAAV